MGELMGDRPNDGSSAGAPRFPLHLCARRSGLCVAGILAATGLLFTWQAALIDLGHIGLPGPGFFPLVLAALVVIFSVIIGIDLWRTPANGETVALLHRDVVIVMAAALAVPLVFDLLGALLTLGLFAVAVLVLIARVPLLLATVSAGAFVAVCWIFFQVLLGLQLPTGPF